MAISTQQTYNQSKQPRGDAFLIGMRIESDRDGKELRRLDSPTPQAEGVKRGIAQMQNKRLQFVHCFMNFSPITDRRLPLYELPPTCVGGFKKDPHRLGIPSGTNQQQARQVGIVWRGFSQKYLPIPMLLIFTRLPRLFARKIFFLRKIL
jgi:hypothetical protein